jgi:hypothetical protein
MADIVRGCQRCGGTGVAKVEGQDAEHGLPPTMSFGDPKHPVFVELWYPRSDDQHKVLQIGLYDVRAADDIQISYDYERDGWVIKQASRFQWDADDEVCDGDWQEVAFIKAWAREVKNDGDAG